MKKYIFKIILVIFTIAFQNFALGIGPPGFYQTWNGCNTYIDCSNNSNYYGRASGTVPPVYFYPQLPYQSMWPQQNYYFPHTSSPYQPVDCPFCNQIQNYQQQQPMFFPNSYQLPGGGIT